MNSKKEKEKETKEDLKIKKPRQNKTKKIHNQSHKNIQFTKLNQSGNWVGSLRPKKERKTGP